MSSQTILIVDDAPTNLAVLSACLESAGYVVLVARDGAMALDIARRAKPDLVLLDVLMPGMGGLETCRRLKADENTRAIPVIFVSGMAEPDERRAGLDAGGVDFITKPIDFDDVAHRVKKCLKETHELRDRDLARSDGRMKKDRGMTDGVLDVQGALRRLGGREQLYVSVLSRFAPQWSEAREIIAQQLASGDQKAAARTAHTVKSESATIGATALNRAAADVEHAIRDNNPRIDLLLSSFANELDRTLKAIDEFLLAGSQD